VMNSRIPRFYNLTLEERRDRVAELAPGADLDAYKGSGLSEQRADQMIENTLGVYGLPLGLATNFQVNGRDVLIPMAVEEPSVVAGASFMAKLCRAGGGFVAESTPPEMIGQMQVLGIDDLEAAEAVLIQHRRELLELADSVDPVLKQLGGGARGLEVRRIQESAVGPFLVVHLIYDVRDAMGANAVNTACEKLAPKIEALTGGRVHLRILSNLADRRLARARCRVPTEELEFSGFSGERVRDGIIEAWAFAAADPYRAATHNKGIMNGVDAVVVATGNDWRAIEAGAHAYAARRGTYTSLSTWSRDDDGMLAGYLEMPMAVGIVGGATKVHPGALTSLRLIGAKSGSELAEIIVSVGLAQNLAALRALATEGIQRGHMTLHARQVAMAAGATGKAIEAVASQMVSEGVVRVDRAEAILRGVQKSSDST
jgi:hydroxymethylglutaryl-CoA reductase